MKRKTGKLDHKVHSKTASLRRLSYQDPDSEEIELTEEFKAALNLMEHTRGSLFISGKAGTGKSTLLKYFKANTTKNVVILAPTGVAAVNVGGQTIHSFLKFPPSIIQRDTIKRLWNTKLIANLEMMVIDEVSMVRADLMDGIDHALRLNRHEPSRPFGGVQMVFIGDLFQLCPVVEPGAREILAERYSTPYFFSAEVFQTMHIKYIELSKIYRQCDNRFVDLLNRIRNNEQTEEDLYLLNDRVGEHIYLDDTEAPVVLTSTNSLAGAINQDKLMKLSEEERVYEAVVTGKFEGSAFPTDGSLRLKAGAQVILLKNDPERKWVNGSLARVAELTKDSIKVDIKGHIHEVPRVTWQKIEYSYNKELDKIEENVVGTFEQFPLKLAWAITIHKSQGQTFDKVVLDLGRGAFTHGQVYVALSRCTCLEGITLKRPVAHRDIIFDERICGFRDKFNSLI